MELFYKNIINISFNIFDRNIQIQKLLAVEEYKHGIMYYYIPVGEQIILRFLPHVFDLSNLCRYIIRIENICYELYLCNSINISMLLLEIYCILSLIFLSSHNHHSIFISSSICVSVNRFLISVD